MTSKGKSHSRFSKGLLVALRQKDWMMNTTNEREVPLQNLKKAAGGAKTSKR